MSDWDLNPNVWRDYGRKYQEIHNGPTSSRVFEIMAELKEEHKDNPEIAKLLIK